MILFDVLVGLFESGLVSNSKGRIGYHSPEQSVIEQDNRMGFYLRKSVSVGPFRVNFSSSGVGVSAGIKGLRVGTGPRGNYISVGACALRYRATLPSSQSPGRLSSSTHHPSDVSEDPRFLSNDIDGMTRIESGPVVVMQDNSSSELLKELRGKAQRPSYWKFSAVATMIAMWFGSQSAMPFLVWIIGVAGVALTIYISVRDTVAKTAVLCYQLEEPNEKAFDSLHNAFAGFSGCSKAWRIDAKGAVKDSK